MRGKRWFTPPHTVRTQYDYPSGKQQLAILYLVPVRPGVTRTFGKYVASAGAVQPFYTLCTDHAHGR